MDGARWHTERPALPFRREARRRAPLQSALALLWDWHRRARERAQLARLDDRALKDIGLNRADVAQEYGKPFWRA